MATHALLALVTSFMEGSPDTGSDAGLTPAGAFGRHDGGRSPEVPYLRALGDDTAQHAPTDPGRVDWPSDFSGPALDPATLERLDRLSPGGSFVAQLARRFLADADTHLCALRTALAEGDIALLSFSAHTLTGSSASVGAAELCRLCSLLSTPQAPTDWSRVASVLAAMDLELERARAAFDAWVSGR